MGMRVGWSAVITFESDRGEPTCVRTTVDVSEPDDAARRAVLRALREGKPRKYESVVIVLTERLGDPARASVQPETAGADGRV
jgi:hypothetical protein